MSEQTDRLWQEAIRQQERAIAAETVVARIKALRDEWAAVSVVDEWDAADRWADAPAALTAALDTPATAEEPRDD